MNRERPKLPRKDDHPDTSSSPYSNRLPVLTDKHNRPFKALTPRRLEPLEHDGGQTKVEFPRAHPVLICHGGGKNRSFAAKTAGKTPEKEVVPDESKISSKRVKAQLCDFIANNEFGSDLVFRGVFGPNLVTYVDYTASGRPLRFIEAYIQQHVLPSYANTHTEVSWTGKQTSAFREEARDIIRKCVNAGQDDYVIFTGSGVTAAINKIVHCLDLEEMGPVVVFVGPYEHHSNILPWIHTKAEVIRIPQNRDGLLDITVLAAKLEEVWNKPQTLHEARPFIIGSFSAASNVTGILTPTYTVCCLIHKYHGVVFWDYACAGPYVPIDMNPPKHLPNSNDQPYKDAVFISPHKFVGGPGTPGILVAKKWLFRNPVPHDAGGGTVLFVRRDYHLYLSNPEHREEGGTPSIIESIRCGLVFKLKDAIGAKYIMKREQAIFRKSLDYLKGVDGLVLLGNPRVERLPILTFLCYNYYTGRLLHHDFLGMIFNDVFGIQVRTGCACAGPYGLDLLGMSEETAEQFERYLTHQVKERGSRSPKEGESMVARNLIYKPGFCRLSLPYFIQDKCMDFVLKAVRLVALYGWSLLPQYSFEHESGRWSYTGKKATTKMARLDDISFASGHMTVDGAGFPDFSDSSMGSEYSSSSSAQPEIDYASILKRAEGLFTDAVSGFYPTEDENKTASAVQNDELRWFMTPKDASDVIHQRQKRSRMKPENLPFMPGALAAKLGINPVGHKGRSSAMDKDFPLEYFPDTEE